MKNMVEIGIVLDAVPGRRFHLQQIIEQARRKMKEHFLVEGFEVINAVTSIRSLTKEESIMLVPPRVHMGMTGDLITFCGKEARKVKRATIWTSVNCKMCLKKKPASLQTVLL